MVINLTHGLDWSLLFAALLSSHPTSREWGERRLSVAGLLQRGVSEPLPRRFCTIHDIPWLEASASSSPSAPQITGRKSCFRNDLYDLIPDTTGHNFSDFCIHAVYVGQNWSWQNYMIWDMIWEEILEIYLLSCNGFHNRKLFWGIW